MPKRMSEEKLDLIKNLVAENLTAAEISRRANISRATAYSHKHHFDSRTEYDHYLDIARINPETGRFFGSSSEYRKYLYKKAQQNLMNQRFSALIKERLEEMGKDALWFFRKFRVNESTGYGYLSGRITPRKRLPRLMRILELSKNDVEEILKLKDFPVG